MESKKINQLATELTPALSDLTIIGDPTTGISKKITLSQMASLFTGTVEEYANLAAFPLVGVADTIYIALDTNIIYRWNTGTSAYVELSPNIVTSLVFSDANGFDGTISLVGSTATLTITTALTQGSVPFIGTSGALSQDNANLFFDDTNNRLGINTNTPTTAIDVFGSGIIGRLNGTSTNNSFLGFASAGTNKWSIGNVQSDHRFRIYNEATTSELVSVLQTGEFGIGIANPTTKLHIDGGASALIANLDANVSVAKSISFRSDNSARINLEVSGTESGSNAGADLFVRTYTDAGALLATPLTITRSTGAITLTGALSGTTANFQTTIGSRYLQIRDAGTSTPSLRSVNDTIAQLRAIAIEANTISLRTGASSGLTTTEAFAISATGAATFSSFVGINGSPATAFPLEAYINSSTAYSSTSRGNVMRVYNSNTGANVFAGIELGGAGTANDGLAGINAVVTGSGSAALTFYTRDGGTFAERFRVSPSGNVGIGTSSPTNPLHIVSNTISQLNVAALSGNTNAQINLEPTGTGVALIGPASPFPLTFRTDATERMRITSGGDVFVGFSGSAPGQRLRTQGADSGNVNYSLVVANSTTASTFLVRNDGLIQTGTQSGSPYNNTSGAAANLVVNSAGTLERSTSSLKYKKDVKDYNKGLAEVLAMRPVYYKGISESDGDKQFAGLIAEEIDALGLNEFVTYAEDGTPDALAYQNMIALLVKGIQEQQELINNLSAKVTALEQKA